MFDRCNLRTAVVFIACQLVMLAAPNLGSAQKRSPDDFPNRVLVLDGSPVHDVGNLRVHASNWGAIGSQPGYAQPFSEAPSAEWPAGSGVEYLWVAGLWVGALVDGLPAVSTSAFDAEFRPSANPLDGVYYSALGAWGGSRVPSSQADDDGDGTLDEDVLDGFDNDLDGLVDEDFAAISDQMLSRRFRDDDPSSIAIFPNHNARHLAVHEESYQFRDPGFDDFVGFTVRITNDGPLTLEDVYVGLFADPDVGHRDTPNYPDDDATALRQDLVVDHGSHGTQAYDFGYWYDVDGDGGNASGYCGIVIFDGPVSTYANLSGGSLGGGEPSNDFERYELMASQTIEQDATLPRDYRVLLVMGPFAEVAPGETIEMNFALVVTPRGDFSNVTRAAQAYHGLWFDLDHNLATGIDGKEHQEHWYLPDENPLPVTFSEFEAHPIDTRTVQITWETQTELVLDGYEIWRTAEGGNPRSLVPGLLAASTDEFVDATVTPGTHYEYRLVAHTLAGGEFSSPRASVNVPNVILSLGQNAPNPFASSTVIEIAIPERADIEVAVFDVAGRRVATITRGTRGRGAHEFTWDGIGDDGNRVGSGVYFYRLKAGGETLTRKLIVMR